VAAAGAAAAVCTAKHWNISPDSQPHPQVLLSVLSVLTDALCALLLQILDAPTSSSGSGNRTSNSGAGSRTTTSSTGAAVHPTRGVWAHSFVGTPNYLAPEMVACEGYGFKADMWAAGCVLYEMAALKPAFRVSRLNGKLLKLHSLGQAADSVYSSCTLCGTPPLLTLHVQHWRNDPPPRPSLTGYTIQSLTRTT
jgi:serine/threonine protein kinase